MALALNNLQRVDMPLNKETKPINLPMNDLDMTLNNLKVEAPVMLEPWSMQSTLYIANAPMFTLVAPDRILWVK